MSRRVKQVAVAFVIVVAAAQFVRPERANPATDATRTIQAHVGTTSELAAVLGSLVPRLSLEQHLVAVVRANRTVVVADGAQRGARAEGGQLLVGWVIYAAVGRTRGVYDDTDSTTSISTESCRYWSMVAVLVTGTMLTVRAWPLTPLHVIKIATSLVAVGAALICVLWVFQRQRVEDVNVLLGFRRRIWTLATVAAIFATPALYLGLVISGSRY